MQTQDEVHVFDDCSPASIDSFFELVEAQLAAAQAANNGRDTAVESNPCA